MFFCSFSGGCGSASSTMKCNACASDLPPGARFCPQCSAPTGGGTDTRRITVLLPEERRIVTVLFSDLKGFTSVAEKKDPEELGEIIAGLFARFARVIEACGGSVDKYIGDAVMALFGAPVAHEDDPVRAMNCALLLHSELAGFNQERGMSLRMRIGINTGEVVWGDIVGGARTVMGDAVNVAQHLEGLAAPGTVVVGPQTRKLAAGAFRFRGLAPTQPKGCTEPIQPFEVESRLDIAPEFHERHGPPSALVGRQRELDALMNAYETVRSASRPRMILLLGEAGVGKSRLLYEFREAVARSAVRPTVAAERCVPYGGSRFHPLAQALKKLHAGGDANHGIEGPAKPEPARGPEPHAGGGEAAEKTREIRFLRALTRELSGLPGHTETDRENFAHLLGIGIAGFEFPDARVMSLDGAHFHDGLKVAFRIWMEAVCARGPFLFIIEDFHWADRETLGLLRDTISRLRDIPLMIVCVGREEGLVREWARAMVPPASYVAGAGPGAAGGKATRFARADEARFLEHTSIIRLGPLPDAAVSELVFGLLACRNITRELEEFVAGKSAGNPYYAAELVRYLIESDCLVHAADGGDGGTATCSLKKSERTKNLPETLNGLLVARIDALGPAVAGILSAASVAGGTFWQGLVEAMVGRPVAKELAEAADRELVLPRAATDIPGEVEFTFKHTLLRDAAYGRLTRRVRRGFHKSAAGWFRAREPAWSKARLLALEAVHWKMADQPARAVRAWLQASEKASGWSLPETDEYLSAAIDTASRAGLMPTAAEPEASRESGREPVRRGATTSKIVADFPSLFEKRARTRLRLGRLADAKADAQALLAQAEGPVARAHASRLIAEVDALQGDVRSAERRYEEALDLLKGEEPLETADILCAQSELLGNVRSRFDEAAVLAEKAMKIATDRIGSVTDAEQAENIVVKCKSALGLQAVRRGRLDTAEPLLREVLAYREKRNDRRAVAIACGNLGLVYEDTGRFDLALELFQRQLAICEEIGYRRGIGLACGNIGQVFSHRGETARVLEYNNRFLAIAEEMGDMQAIAAASGRLGHEYSARGEYDRALEFYERQLAASESLDDERGVGIAVSNIGNLLFARGELSRAMDFFKKNIAIREKIGDTLGLAIGFCNIGNVYDRKGELDKALECQQKYLELSEQIKYRRGVGIACGNIGMIFCTRGEIEKALEYCDRNISIAEESGYRTGVAEAAFNLAAVNLLKGDLDRALEFQQRAYCVCSEVGLAALKTSLDLLLSEIRREQGALDDAVAGARGALTEFRRMGLRESEASAALSLTTTLLAAGKVVEARASLDGAEKLCERADWRDARDRLAFLRVRVLTEEAKKRRAGSRSDAEGPVTRAVEEGRKAVKMLEGSPNPWIRASALGALAGALRAARQTAEADEARRAALDLAENHRFALLARALGDSNDQ
ncbi:MAG: tetratricopeptide repeat protein [Planctomycetota bacterium]|nr:tetratricopeptide repeat protein [Planctomycetota bacterium]